MKGTSLFRSPPAPEISAGGSATPRQRLTVFDIRKKRRSGSCEGTSSGSAFLKPEADRGQKRSFFRRDNVDPNVANVTRRIAKLPEHVTEAVAARIGLEPRAAALWEFLRHHNDSQTPEFSQLSAALDELAADSPIAETSHSPEPVAPLPPPVQIPTRPARAPRLGPLSSYPFIDVRYSYSAREAAVCSEAVTLGMRAFEQTWNVPDGLDTGDRVVVQCFTVGIVPAMVAWPPSCHVYVNDVLVKGTGLCGFPLIDVSDFGGHPRIRVTCGVEHQLYALILRVATFRSYGELVNGLKMGRRVMAPPSGVQEPIVIDPISGRLMENPGRGVNCRHSQCFDLKVYLKKANLTRRWVCPLCNMSATIEELIFDDATAEIIFAAKAESQKPVQREEEVPLGSDFGVNVIGEEDNLTLNWFDS